MKNHLLSLVLFLSIVGFLQVDGQTLPQNSIFECGFDQMQAKAFQNPQIQRKWQQFEETYQKIAQTPSTKSNETLYKIPTVIHIIHNNRDIGTVHNPTNERAAATIEWVNKQLRNTGSPEHNWESPFAGVDSKIELCLANVDPQGNPTTGINRYSLPSQTIDPTDEIDGYNWDVSRYYNIFVVEEITWAGGYYCPSADHIVVESIRNSFSFPLVSHETGHYFSLLHTFGNCTNSNCLVDGDKVCDTPPSVIQSPDCENPENTCQTDGNDTNSRNPYRSTNLGGVGDQPDFANNFMAYSQCYPRFFSEGQIIRMRTNIETLRMDMVNNSELLCNTCQEDLILNETHAATETFQAANTITSTSIIEPMASIVYQANQSITLQPNFHAKVGANFSALLFADPCATMSLTPKIENTNFLKRATATSHSTKPTISQLYVEVYPNPFTYQTTIQFTFAESSMVTCTLYYPNGQQVKQLQSPTSFEKGVHQVHFQNQGIAPGLYFLHLSTTRERIVKKVIVNPF